MPLAKTAAEPVPAKEPMDAQTLAMTIKAFSAVLDDVLKSGLNQRAIIVLLSDATGLSKRVCKQVLDGLADMRRRYTK